jgi:hypothetical protein
LYLRAIHGRLPNDREHQPEGWSVLELRRDVRIDKKRGSLCFDLLAGSFPVLIRTPLLASILFPEVIGQSADTILKLLQGLEHG